MQTLTFFIISVPLLFYQIFTDLGVYFLALFVSTFLKVLADLVVMPLLAILLELAETFLVKLADIILLFSHAFILVLTGNIKFSEWMGPLIAIIVTRCHMFSQWVK